MSVSITLVQKNTTVTNPTTGAPSYTSDNEVPATLGIPLQLFVFNTTTGEYSHVAATADVEAYPVGQATAVTQGKPFYREAKVVRTFTNILDAQAFADHVKQRMQYLTNEYPVAQDTFLGDTTTTFVTQS